MKKRTRAIVLSLILMIVCVGMGYWLYLFLRYLRLPWAREELNHFLVLASGMGLWLGLMIFFLFEEVGKKSQTMKLWKWILIEFTWIAAIIILLMGGLLGVAMGTMMLPTQISLEISLSPEVIQTRTILFSIYLGFLVYSVLYLLTIGTHQTLKKGFIAKRDGKLIYPNTVHFVWPFYGYDEVIKKEIRLDLDFSLPCRDGKFKIWTTTSILLDFEKAQEQGISSLNLREILAKAEKWLSEIIRKDAQNKTFGELLKVKYSPAERDINGLTVVWPGGQIALEDFQTE